jgi:hypothetical protein
MKLLELAERFEKMATKKKPTKPLVECAHCGKQFQQSDLGAWSDIIMKHKPACSYECNKQLGQVK